MKFNEILTEGRNNPMIVIDVQPAYQQWFDFEDELAQFLNQRTGKVWMMFNGDESGTSPDSLFEVQDWWQEQGLEEHQIQRFRWTDKGYAFFRSWMDMGVSNGTIIKVLREMLRQDVYDSRDLFDGETDKLENFVGSEWDDMMIDDSIYIPHELAANELKEFNGCYICGGGEHACMQEVLIWMSVFNIKYKILKRFVYSD